MPATRLISAALPERTPGTLHVERGEIRFQPYGGIGSGEFTLTYNLPPEIPPTATAKERLCDELLGKTNSP
jgi:hypothetical protein